MCLGVATESRHVVILKMMSRMFDPKVPWEEWAIRKHETLQLSYVLLRELSANDKSRLNTIDQLERMSNAEWDALSVLPKAEPGTSMLQNLASCTDMPALLKLGVNNGIEISALVQKENAALSETRAREQVARDRLKSLVYTGLAANIALAALLLYLFNRDITGASELACRQCSPTAITSGARPGGGRQTARLSGYGLHEASEHLSAADDHRRSVMEMVAHDMRSPLMAAQVSTEVLNHPSTKNCRLMLRKCSESVRQYINHVLRLVNELLTIERFEAGKIELELSRFNVKDAVSDAISTYLDLGDFKDVSIENNCAEQIIRADKEKFEHLIVNYITSVRTFPGSRSEIVISTETKPDAIIISVNAPGPPLDRGRRSDLFKKFPKYGGKNRADDLALASCRLIARFHGGAVGFRTSGTVQYVVEQMATGRQRRS